MADAFSSVQFVLLKQQNWLNADDRQSEIIEYQRRNVVKQMQKRHEKKNQRATKPFLKK